MTQPNSANAESLSDVNNAAEPLELFPAFGERGRTSSGIVVPFVGVRECRRSIFAISAAGACCLIIYSNENS